MFEQSVARTPERYAVVDVDTGESLTYKALRDQAHAVGTALGERGIEAGDRVAICAANHPAHVSTFLATQLFGFSAVSFNFRLPADGVRYHVEDSEPEVLLYDEFSRDAVEAARDDLDCELIYVGDDIPNFATPFEELRKTAGEEPTVDVDESDTSVILYSSGTTGDPKGIPLDHEATVSRVLANSMGQRYYLDERMIGVMPLYHTVGLHGILCGLLTMSGTYLCLSAFDPELAADAIETYDVTALHEAPTIFNQLVETGALADADVSSVERIGYSGAPMSSTLFEKVIDIFDPEHIANLYGTTEAYGTLSYVDLHDIRDPTVCGPANVFYEVRIVRVGSKDPTDTVEDGEEGELVVNTDSPVAFDGYLNKPHQTEAAIHDGWFFTGDAARRTDDGNIVITGRTDDMIITGGENVYPAEVEDVLHEHPTVTDVGVVGEDHEEWGEIVVAYVQTDGDVSAEEFDQWCVDSDELADFKRPREYRFVEEIPRNPSGKIMRYKLRGEDD